MSPKYLASHSNTAAPAPALHEYACLVIGDEILSGHVRESNVPYIITALNPRGYNLQEARIVTDAPEDIARHLSELRDAFAFVISLGGLGPTHDDRTMQGYALSFGCERVVHKDMHEFFMEKPRTTEEQLSAVQAMSTMPQAVEVIRLGSGWPLLKMENCFALPGLPSICRKTVDILASILPPHEALHYCECFVTLAEHEFALWLSQLHARYPVVCIGSYPIDKDMQKHEAHVPEERVARSKIALTSSDESAFKTCCEELCTYINTRDAMVRMN